MAFANSIDRMRSRPEIAMAALGLASGVLSVIVGMDLERPWLGPVAVVFFLDTGSVPIGFFFGAAIALSLWMATRNVWTLPVLPVVVMYAWSAAIQVAIRLQRNTDDDPHLIAASLLSGLVGAGITHLGCAIFAPELRRPARLALTCAVGAAAGLLLYASQRNLIDGRLLFIVWQPAVASCIGLGLRGQTLRV